MKRLLFVVLAVSFLACFVGHGLAHGGAVKEDRCAVCAGGPAAAQAKPELRMPAGLSFETARFLAARPDSRAADNAAARSPPR